MEQEMSICKYSVNKRNQVLQEFFHRFPPLRVVQLGLNFAFQSGVQKVRYHKEA